MENASKALIIAGAILLSIAIIGIGMYIYTTAQQTIQSANMSQQEITAYNSEFIKYEGTQSGSNVKALLQTVRTHNIVNKDDTSKQIVVNKGGSSSGDVTDTQNGTDQSNISNYLGNTNAGTQYNVTFDYSSTGLIKRININ